MTVVLVEDNSDLRAILAITLRRFGFGVKQAATGSRGLELALAEPTPDLIVLDQNLPEFKGTDIARKVRQDGSEVPIILISGDDDVAQVAQKAGLCHCLRKPFTGRDLERVVKKALETSP